MFSHHTRKAFAGQDSDQKQSGRGTSAIKGWADSAWYLKSVGDVLSVETKQREGSIDFPAVPSFCLRRIEDRAERSQRWEVSQGVEEDMQARHDAPRVLEAVLASGGEITNKLLEKAVRLNGQRLDSALTYLQGAGTIRVEFELRVSADNKKRNQKVIRLNRGTEDNRGQNHNLTVVHSTEVPRSTTIGGDGSSI